ncbi:arginine--tRNA ligase, chloroplastic/mitochondrial [Tanacetum coccineum]
MVFDTSTMEPFTPSPNRKYNRSSVFPKIKRIFARILRRCHFQSNSEINAFIRPLEGEAREYGDYVCFNVLEICDELRKKNPDLFDEIKPKDIAMEISRELKLENTDKISRDSIQLHDIGVISFMLHESYIAKRVMKMLIGGIDTCAPVIYESKAKAVFLSRTNIPAAAVDMLRANFIKDNSRDGSLNEALAGKEERELAFHLVQYTGVIEKVCAGFVPNFVCEYPFILSKLFTSCYSKASLNYQLLCKTALVVMDKCFDLLGISPVGLYLAQIFSNSVFGSVSYPNLVMREYQYHTIIELVHVFTMKKGREEIMSSILSSYVERGPCRELAEARCKYLNSQFEIFSMNVDVADLTLDEYDIFRTVSIIDTFGARVDGWTMYDENDCCFVTYFKREWHNPLGTFNSLCTPFGEPSCRRSVPVSSSVDVHVLVQVLSKNRDRYYKICYVPHVESFSDFWTGQGKAKSGTLQFESKAGLIIAYYGDGMVKDDGGILGQLKAVLFRIGKSELNGNQVPLEMHKSVVAVPVDGCLMIKAFLMDVKTNKVIWDDMIEYRAKPGNADNWSIKCKGYSFNLKVAWSEFTSA